MVTHGVQAAWCLGRIIALSIWIALLLISRPYAAESGMVLIPKTKFVMGTDSKKDADTGVDEIPPHQVSLSAFYIDLTEVTVSRYMEFIHTTTRTLPHDPRFFELYPWTKDNPPPAEIADHPVIYVSWYDADAYCQFRGKRLPTEEEWEYAAGGGTGRKFPWGDKPDKSKANVKETNAGGTLPVKSMKGDVSPSGVYDMGGNVSEWTASWYKAYPGSTLKRNEFGEKYKIVRGGSWLLNMNTYSRVQSRSRAEKPTKRHRGIGFRCAKDGG